MNKTDKPLARLKQNNKKEQAQMINIRNKRRTLTTDPTDIKRKAITL